MNFLKQEKIKYKLLSFDELVINLDRLSRFKLPEESYFRVFSSIICKCLIYPKYSKNELVHLPFEFISKYVELIWNESVKNIFGNYKNNKEVNKSLKLLINSVFKNIDSDTKILINSNLNISVLLQNIDYNSAPLNIKILIKANETFNLQNPVSEQKLKDISRKYLLKFPPKKLLIVEGVTEENLLPVFAKKLKRNFDENGVYVLGAGGKSKSPDLYLKLKDKLKIPVILLFDSDASEICDILQQNLLKKDKTIIINKGEFEDILSVNLIKRALNNEYQMAAPITLSDLKKHGKMCENIEDLYRTHKLGEFKKAKLSKIIAKNIKYDSDITHEIKDIINQLT